MGTVYSGNTDASEISPGDTIILAIFSLLDRTNFVDFGSLRSGPCCAKRVTGRTNSCRLDHVADGESLYRLVLGCTSRAVGASDRLDVTAPILVATAELRYQLPMQQWL